VEPEGRRVIMTRWDVNDVRCAALFASGLQRSEVPDSEAVTEAVRRTVGRLGVRGCAGAMAQEFGDHPESARDRMRWIRQLVDQPPARPAFAGTPCAA
jgi:hypothetical protein